MARQNPTDPLKGIDKPLSGREEAFCKAFLLAPSATAAAREAGYKDSRSLRGHAHLLAHRPRIQKRIAELRGETHAAWLEQYKAMVANTAGMRQVRMAEASLADYVDEDGNVDLEALRDDGIQLKRLTIKKTTTKHGVETTVNVELPDPRQANEYLLRLVSGSNDDDGKKIDLHIHFSEQEKGY